MEKHIISNLLLKQYYIQFCVCVCEEPTKKKWLIRNGGFDQMAITTETISKVAESKMILKPNGFLGGINRFSFIKANSCRMKVPGGKSI